MKDNRIDKLWTDLELAKRKDFIEIEIEKNKFAKTIKKSVGKQINDFNTYVKPEPSFFSKLKAKIVRIFKYI